MGDAPDNPPEHLTEEVPKNREKEKSNNPDCC